MYGAGKLINSSPQRVCNSIRALHEEELPSIKERSPTRNLTKRPKRTLRNRKKNDRERRAAAILATIVFLISFQALQVKAEVATYQDDQIAVYIVYRLGSWSIIAKNGTKVIELFNVTVYTANPKIAVKVNNRSVAWGEVLQLRAKANERTIIKVQYGNRTIRLVFNVITAKEAKKEIEKKLIELTLQELQNLKTKYVIIGALIGCIAILNGYLIKRRALLIERRAVLGLAFGFVMLSLFINMNISANYNEPPWYWIVYTISLLIATFSIPPPRGVYILEPELSKRNINLDYYAVYKDRRGVPRIAEQSVGAGLRRLFGIENDPVLVNGITKETMSLTTNWTLNYEDPLIISARSEFREIKLEGEGEEE